MTPGIISYFFAISLSVHCGENRSDDLKMPSTESEEETVIKGAGKGKESARSKSGRKGSDKVGGSHICSEEKILERARDTCGHCDRKV